MSHTRAVSVFALTALLGFAAAAKAEHFAISLTVQSPHDRAEAHSDDDPPAQGLNPRPLCRAKSGEPLLLQFLLTSNFPHGTKPAVIIRYFIAPEKDAGHKAPREPGKPAVLEGSFIMNFKPDGRVGLRQRLHIDHPGAYLVRVESEHSDSDHEHFAALDLVIE